MQAYFKETLGVREPEARPPLRLRRGTTFVTRFHPGVNHDHRPTGRWAAVQADAAARCATLTSRARSNPRGLPGIAQALATECACANFSPANVARFVRNTIMLPLPLARRHLDHYLAGSGTNLVVDLEDVVRRDSRFRAKLAAHVRSLSRGHFKVFQHDYAVKDFQFAFGALDRLDFEVDRTAGLVHVWFQDRYEWHPVGFGYKLLPGDGRRPTNCVHAAMVELKSSGARDYWMVGDAVIPLSLVLASSPPPSGPAGPMGLDQFTLDSATLNANHVRLVEHLARRIASSWSMSTPIRVVHLVGHADSSGPPAYNVALGLRRAQAARGALVQALERARAGVTRGITFFTASRGATQPVTSARTPTAMARNRRVAVSLDTSAPGPVGESEWPEGYEAYPQRSREAPVARPPIGDSPAAPALPPPLLYSETVVPSETDYVKIVLGQEGPAAPMTGIFVPAGYHLPSQIDLVLYLHGHHKTPPRFPPSLSIDDYWSGRRLPAFAFRQGVNISNKNVILVAPTLGPSSETGKLITNGGLAWYLDQVLEALRAHGPFKAAEALPPLGHIVLACHSGGGAPMRAIALTPQKYSENIRQCWGFDCLYSNDDPDAWTTWAKKNPAKKLFIYFGNGGTAAHSRLLQSKAAGLSNVSVEGSDSLPHNRVPMTYWQRRLSGARFLLAR